MTPIEIFINDQKYMVNTGQTVLEVCRDKKIQLQTLCALKGLTNVGACRLCLVEMEGTPRLFPACTLQVAPNQHLHTDTERLRKYRKMTVELLFSERNHICAVCVANRNCELQDLAKEVGMDHVRFPFLMPVVELDASHPNYVIDHNRCVMCARCVRVCDEVEGAHVWDIMGRGHNSRIVSGFHDPWGESDACTWCGKCVMVCPVGALWHKDAAQGKLQKHPDLISELVQKRKEK